MPEQMHEDFKASFLLMLTKEIIENTETYKSLKIKKEVKDFIVKEKTPALMQIPIIATKKEGIREVVHGKIKKEHEKISEMRKAGFLPSINMNPRPIQRFTKTKAAVNNLPPVLHIPEPTLPATVSYLKPLPTGEEINLEKLNALVKDPLVKIIECNGPEENVIVMGIMGRRATSVKLSKEEINETLEKFAVISKIPLHEGLFKAVVGNLIISAVISEIVGIKFIIRKISRGP